VALNILKGHPRQRRLVGLALTAVDRDRSVGDRVAWSGVQGLVAAGLCGGGDDLRVDDLAIGATQKSRGSTAWGSAAISVVNA